MISVLLPAYQAEATIEACLESVARQTERDFECVVVDDGSTDRTPEIARRFAARDPRFHVDEGPHRGLVPTLMRGLARCSRPLVARMDADDLMHRRRLERQRAALGAQVAIGCHVRLFPRRGLGPGARSYERWLRSIRDAESLRREAFVECPLAHPTLLVRRAALERFGYRDMGWPEDYDLVLRLLEAGETVGMLPERLLAWRDGPGRLSKRHPMYAIDAFIAAKAHFLARGFLADRERYVLWGYGRTGKKLAKALGRHDRHPSQIIEIHEGRIGQRILDVPVESPAALTRLRGERVLASVAGAEARAEIRAQLDALGFVETRDYVLAA